jgi:hypothetical protein
MMRFNYCWHYIFTDYPFIALKDKGFDIEPISDDMVSGFKCNSVLFSKDGFIQELQYRELLDEEEFLSQQRQKQNVGGSVHDFLRPGVCFQHDSLNEEFFLNGLEIRIGKTMGAKNQNEPLPRNDRMRLTGLLWNLSDNDLEYFCRRANLKVVDNKIRVSDDFHIFLAEKNSELYTEFEARKDFPFWGVVIEADSLGHFGENPSGDLQDNNSDEIQPIRWMNQSAILIKHHITHWDIILTYTSFT